MTCSERLATVAQRVRAAMAMAGTGAGANERALHIIAAELTALDAETVKVRRLEITLDAITADAAEDELLRTAEMAGMQ